MKKPKAARFFPISGTVQSHNFIVCFALWPIPSEDRHIPALEGSLLAQEWKRPAPE